MELSAEPHAPPAVPARREFLSPIEYRRPYGPQSRHLDDLEKCYISYPCPKLVNAIFAKIETFLLFNIVFPLDLLGLLFPELE